MELLGHVIIFFQGATPVLLLRFKVASSSPKVLHTILVSPEKGRRTGVGRIWFLSNWALTFPQFLGHPHHGTFLLFSSPLSDEPEVFDRLSIITEVSKGSRQNPGDSCALGTLCEPGPQELGSKDKAPSRAQGEPLLLTSTSEV